MSEVVDLDALMPLPAKIKFGGGVLDVDPPKTGDILMMAQLFRKVREDDLTQEVLDQRVLDLTNHLYKMVPALNSKPLSFTQIVRLTNILDDMALPPDAKEAGASGITVDNPKKA